MGETEDQNEDFNYIVRIAGSDIAGEKSAVVGVQSVKGIGKRAAEIVVKKAGIPWMAKMGNLSDEDVKKLESMTLNYADNVPAWALNRQHDYETGVDTHLIGNELEMTQKDDINRLKMIRCYRGIRHENHQKVRGQRTRSNGRTGLTLGVSKKRR